MMAYAPHVVVATSRINLDANASGTPNIDQSLDDFKGETSAILSAASPFICTLVGVNIKELVGLSDSFLRQLQKRIQSEDISSPDTHWPHGVPHRRIQPSWRSPRQHGTVQ
jgi:hypothetical protein